MADSILRFNWRSYAIGFFILFQLIYLPTANAIKLIALRLPESKGELDDDIQLRGQAFGEPLQTAADAVGTSSVRYGELTGQAQGWSLFAPVFGHQASLPVVGFNPRSPRAPRIESGIYFRLPRTDCRLFNYEYRLALMYWTWDERNAERDGDKWRRILITRVRRQNKSMLAFMRWKTDCALAAFPTMPNPTTVRLTATLVSGPPIRDAMVFQPNRHSLPIAVWRPKERTPPGLLPVQAQFDRDEIWLPIEEPPP